MRCLAIVFTSLLLFAPRADARSPVTFSPPVDAPIAASFIPPESDYGSGHRGVDYRVPVGTQVRAVAPGIVSFAGSVAGVLAVTIDHGSGIESTYTGLSRVDVSEGERVDGGRYVGASGGVHGAPGLHLGAKVNGEYVDPSSFLNAIDLGGAIHLAPLEWTSDQLGVLGRSLVPAETVGTGARDCRPPRELVRPELPPNDNIAVAVAGITSKTRGGVSADIYEYGPELLGYPRAATYHFSYAGTEGTRFHEPYGRRDTYIDIRTAAARLRALMRRIAEAHPGRHVDLIAHSQGGIVARTYLTRSVGSGDRLPVVEHLVTYASPHRGAPGASQVDPLRDETLTGRYVLSAATYLSKRGLPIPDPTSTAVRQLAPGSALMESLAREDTAFGTRVLALAIPNDPVVPADHAAIPGKQGRIVPWTGAGLGGHSAIVTSPVAHGIAYSFLSDRAPTCTTRWDAAGPRVGSLWSALESSMATAYRAVERGWAAAAGPVGVLLYEAARP